DNEQGRMPFNSLAYALLLTCCVAWMAIGPWRALMLIVASLIFYAAAGPFDMAVFLSAVILNWLVQVAIPADRRRIVAAVVVNIGLIGDFKYRNMLLGDANVTGSFVDTALPRRISCYSLQALAYHIDIVRHRNPPARSFPEFLLFKAFFPQLIAGPRQRAHGHQHSLDVGVLDDRARAGCGRAGRATLLALAGILQGLLGGALGDADALQADRKAGKIH